MIRNLIPSFLQILVRPGGRANGADSMGCQAGTVAVNPVDQSCQITDLGIYLSLYLITYLGVYLANLLDGLLDRGQRVAKPKFTELIWGMASQRSGRSMADIKGLTSRQTNNPRFLWGEAGAKRLRSF